MSTVFAIQENYSLHTAACSPTQYHSLGPLAPKPYTHKLIGMLGAIICAASIIFVGYMSVGVAGEAGRRIRSNGASSSLSGHRYSNTGHCWCVLTLRQYQRSQGFM